MPGFARRLLRVGPAGGQLTDGTEKTISTGDSYTIPPGPCARRLHHCRDLGEPFDFLTWFDFSIEDEGRFDELLARLRETEEWKYVEREVDVRVERDSDPL